MGESVISTREIPLGITLGLLLISPMFLALDHQGFFSASADLDLFVNPYFPVYVLIFAASLALVSSIRPASISSS